MAATQITVAGLANGETAWRLDTGETVIVRVAGATKPEAPAWFYLVTDARIVEPATGAVVWTADRFVHSIRAADLETGHPLAWHVERQQQAACARAANARAAHRALAQLPVVTL